MSNNKQIKYEKGSWKTPAHIEAEGNIQIRMSVIKWIGILCAILAIGGLIAYCIYPDKAKDIWVIVGPILSGAITGMIGFLAGERNASRKSSDQ